MNNKSYFAFVLMPFNSEFDDIYKIGIKETALKLNITAERVDEQLYGEGIIQRIYKQIEIADIIIADMTGKNANVFYEVGYAHAKEKIVILLTQKSEDIPFDLKNRRHIVYGTSIQDLRNGLNAELKWAITQIDNKRKSQIRIDVKSITAVLEKTTWSAKAILEFKIDLHNDSCVPSADIESIYFYSTKNWTITQSGDECPSTKSDLEPFAFRHYLKPPLTRLLPNGWAQLKFKASKHLAFALKGTELKDSYPICGRSVIRFITDRGIFDYDVDINVTADVCPF